jgi:hypothetical protein
MARKIIDMKLNREEARALLDAGNAGVAQLRESDEDADQQTADAAGDVLFRLGELMTAAGWLDE